MKILSNPEGDGLLTNAEVHEWLKEKKFETERRDVPEGVIKPPPGTASISKQVRKYIESSPAGNVSVASLRTLFAKLDKFKLSGVEKLMIANIRPEAYAHLTPLIVDAYSRFDEDQLYEMLEVVNATLEKRTKPTEWNSGVVEGDGEPVADTEMNGKTEVSVQEAAEEVPAVREDGQAVQTVVKEETSAKEEDTIEVAANAVQAVNLSSRDPSCNAPS